MDTFHNAEIPNYKLKIITPSTLKLKKYEAPI